MTLEVGFIPLTLALSLKGRGELFIGSPQRGEEGLVPLTFILIRA